MSTRIYASLRSENVSLEGVGNIYIYFRRIKIMSKKRDYFTINPSPALTQLIRMEYERSRQIATLNGERPMSLSGYICSIIGDWFTAQNESQREVV